MNFWSGLSQPCIFYSTLNANAEIWSNFAHSRLHSLCHSAAEFGTVAYVILLEGKRLQASASPAGRVWLCRENEDNKHKLCIIFPLSLFNLHSCTLLYCTVIQFWLQPQISLMSKKLLSFIFMKGPCTFLFFFFFFICAALLKLQVLVWKKEEELTTMSYISGEEKNDACLYLGNPQETKRMIRPISVSVSSSLSSPLCLPVPSVAYGMFLSHL